MYAVEFKARVADGMIPIPDPYRNQINDMVRVIVLMEAPATEETYINLLFAEPLRVPDFEPMHRDETHDRS